MASRWIHHSASPCAVGIRNTVVIVRLVGGQVFIRGQVFRRSFAVVGLGLLLFALVSCEDSPRRLTSTASAAAPEISPTATRAAAPPAQTEFLASGPLVVENQLDVASQREGIIAKLYVDTGRAVRQGDLLATIDDRQL